MINKQVLKPDERALLTLRSLYGSYGYLPFKMSKFEEYDLYVRNKDFLISDSIITFTDTSGKLMALKPDVTLSIIKNGVDEAGCKQKVYYNENVYRPSGETRQYKEIMQAGLECIGDIGVYDLYETLYLAAESLRSISEDFVLEISHLGILRGILDDVNGGADFDAEIIRLVKEKNAHEIAALCRDRGVSEEMTETLRSFVSIYGDPDSVLERLEPICQNPVSVSALDTLRQIRSLFGDKEIVKNLRFDFSLVSDMNYYSGIVFGGFIDGIPESVLSGGQYGKLMKKMGRRSDAIGFALYLDLLEGLEREGVKYDVDVLLLCSGDTDAAVIAAKTGALVAEGRSVSVQRAIPEKLRYRELIEL